MTVSHPGSTRTFGATNSNVVGSTADALITDPAAFDYSFYLGAQGTQDGFAGAPGGPYGYWIPQAPGLWVVQVDGTLHRDLEPLAMYDGPTITSAKTCQVTHVKWTVYGWFDAKKDPRTGQIDPAHWVHLSEASVTGSWVIVPVGGAYCNLIHQVDRVLPSSYSSIRVGGEADIGGGYQPVWVGAQAL